MTHRLVVYYMSRVMCSLRASGPLGEARDGGTKCPSLTADQFAAFACTNNSIGRMKTGLKGKAMPAWTWARSISRILNATSKEKKTTTFIRWNT